jgi:hypothetical protein
MISDWVLSTNIDFMIKYGNEWRNQGKRNQQRIYFFAAKNLLEHGATEPQPKRRKE